MVLTNEQIALIQPSQVTDWLRGSGFQRAATSAPWAASFAHFQRRAFRGLPAIEVGVPLETSFIDYRRRLVEMLEGLGAAMGRSPESLLQEIQVSDQDVIRLRAKGPALSEGLIPVSVGARLMDSARELVLAAASSAVRPKAVFQGRPLEEARDFLDRIKLAPSERGSFVIRAMTPVGRSELEFDDASAVELPFARRATLMLGKALSTAANAAREAAIDHSYDGLLNSAKHGVSANLCAAIGSIVDGEIVKEMEISIRWAASRPAPSCGSVEQTFSRESAEVLREAAGRIRAVAPRDDFAVLGPIVRLESQDPGRGGRVVVATQVDGRPRSVRIELAADQYQAATRSHANRGELLACEGELTFQGPMAHLKHARDVQFVCLDDQ